MQGEEAAILSFFPQKKKTFLMNHPYVVGCHKRKTWSLNSLCDFPKNLSLTLNLRFIKGQDEVRGVRASLGPLLFAEENVTFGNGNDVPDWWPFHAWRIRWHSHHDCFISCLVRVRCLICWYRTKYLFPLKEKTRLWELYLIISVTHWTTIKWNESTFERVWLE